MLSDDDKRAIYDRYGEAGLKQGAFGGGGNPNVDFSNPFDIFESFFGGGMGGGGMGGFGGMGGQRRRNGPVQGEDERCVGGASSLDSPGTGWSVPLHYLSQHVEALRVC